MKTLRSIALAIAFAFMLVFVLPVNAQRISQLTLSTFTGFSSIKSQSGTVTLVNLSGSISGQYSLSMPFAFKYDDNVYASGSVLYVQVAGSASFTSNTGSSYNNILTYGTPSTYNSAFAVLSGLQYSSSTYATCILYRTTGSAPNRVLTVEWNTFGDYTTMAYRYSYQLKLYETSNTIEFLYDQYNQTTTNSSYCGSYKKGVGLNGRTSPSFIQRIVSSASCTTPSSNFRFSALPDIQLAASPKVLNYGAQLNGTVVDLAVTVQHSGSEGLLNITSAMITGSSSSDFEIVDPVTPPTDIPVGGSVTYTIRYTAGAPGPRGASLVLTSNGRDSGTQSIALTAFGIAPEIEITDANLFKGIRRTLGESQERAIVIKSKTTAPLFFINYPNSFIFSGDGAPAYEIVRLPQNPLPGGMVDTLVVRFAPTSEGTQFATLTVNSNSAINSSLTIALKGTGILPRIVMMPETMHFDSVAMGQTATKKFTIYNPGSDTLRILNNYFSSADQDFTLTPLSGSDMNIAPEKSREVSITFRPLQKGTRSARYQVITNIPLTFEQPRRDTAGSTLYFEITGTGIPVAALSTDIAAAGIQDASVIGQQKCEDVVLSNTGDADALISGITFGGTAAGDYAVKGITFPYNLKAKSQVTIQVCGTPAGRGSRLSTMTINATSSERPVTYSASVDIQGLLLCADAAPASAFQTSLVTNNASESVDVTVTNCGDVATTYTPAINGADALSYTVTPATFGPVDPNMTATFKVTFTPTSRGVKTGSLVINGDNGVAPMTVALGGEGACAVPEAQATVLAPKTKTQLTNPVVFPITVNNSGNLAWNVGTPTITGDAAYAYVAAGSDVTIPANGSGVINVSFHPSVVGVVNAVLTFVGSGPCEENALTINIAGEGFEDLGVTDVRTAEGFILGQNAPNPTLGSTSFNYTVPTGSNVRIILADVTGKTVRELVNSHVSAGTYSVDVNTTGLASGTYLYIMEAGHARLVRQMAVSK